jgi:thioredoxin 1
MNAQEHLKSVNDASFDADVLKAERPTLVDFWAPWCGPCRAMGPVLEEIARDYEGRLNVVKVNVDENPKISLLYGVRSIPTLLLIKDGEIGNPGRHVAPGAARRHRGPQSSVGRIRRAAFSCLRRVDRHRKVRLVGDW